MIKFSDKNNFIEIDLISIDEHMPSHGDACISIRINSSGFQGVNDLYVPLQSLNSFCKDLVKLEKKRIGEACLISIMPGELDLKMFSVDSSGHMGVTGKTAYNIPSEHASFNHSVEFGFEFDPSQLQDAINTEWVKRTQH